MLLLRSNQTLVRTDAIARHPTNYSSKLDSCIKTHNSQHRRQREGQENLEEERVTGSLMSAIIEVKFDSFKLTRLFSRGFQSDSNFRRHCHCNVGITRDLPDLKINTSKWLFFFFFFFFFFAFAFRRLVHVEGEPDLCTVWQTGISGLFNFIYSSYIRAQSCVWRTIHTGHGRTN